MEKEVLEKMIKEMSVRNMAKSLGVGYSTIRYWLGKYGITERSKVRTWNKEQMLFAIRESKTVADVLRRINLQVRPGNYSTIRRFVRENDIDISHFDGTRKRRGGTIAKSLDEIMIENSCYCRTHLKKRLIKEGLIENKCQICGQLPEWQGKPMVLILDHINGVNDDNRKENLRLVCPNCNSQLETNCGKNKK